MNVKNMEEHMSKEIVKKIIDGMNGYTEKAKSDLKNIVDAGRTPEEVIQEILLYVQCYKNIIL